MPVYAALSSWWPVAVVFALFLVSVGLQHVSVIEAVVQAPQPLLSLSERVNLAVLTRHVAGAVASARTCVSLMNPPLAMFTLDFEPAPFQGGAFSGFFGLGVGFLKAFSVNSKQGRKCDHN